MIRLTSEGVLEVISSIDATVTRRSRPLRIISKAQKCRILGNCDERLAVVAIPTQKSVGQPNSNRLLVYDFDCEVGKLLNGISYVYWQWHPLSATGRHLITMTRDGLLTVCHFLSRNHSWEVAIEFQGRVRSPEDYTLMVSQATLGNGNVLWASLDNGDIIAVAPILTSLLSATTASMVDFLSLLKSRLTRVNDFRAQSILKCLEQQKSLLQLMDKPQSRNAGNSLRTRGIRSLEKVDWTLATQGPFLIQPEPLSNFDSGAHRLFPFKLENITSNYGGSNTDIGDLLAVIVENKDTAGLSSKENTVGGRDSVTTGFTLHLLLLEKPVLPKWENEDLENMVEESSAVETRPILTLIESIILPGLTNIHDLQYMAFEEDNTVDILLIQHEKGGSAMDISWIRNQLLLSSEEPISNEDDDRLTTNSKVDRPDLLSETSNHSTLWLDFIISPNILGNFEICRQRRSVGWLEEGIDIPILPAQRKEKRLPSKPHQSISWTEIFEKSALNIADYLPSTLNTFPSPRLSPLDIPSELRSIEFTHADEDTLIKLMSFLRKWREQVLLPYASNYEQMRARILLLTELLQRQSTWATRTLNHVNQLKEKLLKNEQQHQEVTRHHENLVNRFLQKDKLAMSKPQRQSLERLSRKLSIIEEGIINNPQDEIASLIIRIQQQMKEIAL